MGLWYPRLIDPIDPITPNPITNSSFLTPHYFPFFVARKVLFVNKFAPLGVNFANSYGGHKKSLYLCITTRACVRVRGASESQRQNIKTYSNEEFMENDACCARYVVRSSM